MHLTIISKAKVIAQLLPQRCESQSKQYSTVIFLNFGISSQFFVIILKFYHKVIPSKDADRNANSFYPDQTVSLLINTVSTEKMKSSSWLWEL